MAGHSKWANTKHRKAAQDSKRGKVFTKIIRELSVAARQGGGNPADNPRLRGVIDKALTANMKRDVINNAIARGVGSDDHANMEELTYEGYGVGGVAFLVETMTDNRNRTASEVRHAFSKRGGNLGTDGSVAFMFKRIGQISYAPGAAEDAIMMLALEAGADDVVCHDDGSIDVITQWEDFSAIKQALIDANLAPIGGEITMQTTLQVSLDKEAAEKILALIDHLEDLDDVQNVYTNADIPDDVMEQLG